MTRNSNQGHVALNILTMLNGKDVMFNIDNTYLMYKKGFLRSTVVYLKNLSFYLR